MDGDLTTTESPIVGSVPVPDPTKLTTDAVNAATDQWHRELVSVQRLIEARLDGMDKATNLRLANIIAGPKRIKDEVKHLRELVDSWSERLNDRTKAEEKFFMERIARIEEVAGEKFKSIDERFAERDDRTKQAASDSRIQLDAALAAAKEAVSEQNKANSTAIGKSEENTQKQIDNLERLMTTSTSALSDKIADIKETLAALEGRSSGLSAGWGILVGVVGVITAVVSVVVLLSVR